MSEGKMHSPTRLLTPMPEMLTRLDVLIAEGEGLVARVGDIPESAIDENDRARALYLDIDIWTTSVIEYLERSFTSAKHADSFRDAKHDYDYQPAFSAAEATEFAIVARNDVLKTLRAVIARGDIQAHEAVPPLTSNPEGDAASRSRVTRMYRNIASRTNDKGVDGLTSLVRDSATLAKLLGDEFHQRLFELHLRDMRNETPKTLGRQDKLNEALCEAYIVDRTFDADKVSPVPLAQLEAAYADITEALESPRIMQFPAEDRKKWSTSAAAFARIMGCIRERVGQFTRDHAVLLVRPGSQRAGRSALNEFQSKVLSRFLSILPRGGWLAKLPGGQAILDDLVDKYDTEELAEVVVEAVDLRTLRLSDLLQAAVIANDYQNLAEMVWAICSADQTVLESTLLNELLTGEYEWLSAPIPPRGIVGASTAREAKLAYEAKMKEERAEILASRSRLDTLRAAVAHAHPQGYLLPNWSVESVAHLHPLPNADEIVVELHPSERVSLTKADIKNDKRKRNLWYELRTSDTVIVFVHGFLSNSYDSWHDKSSGAFWPDLVRGDVVTDHASIFLGGYEADYASTDYGIADCANELRAGLMNGGWQSVLSRKRIVFVAHSLGGVVVRYMLERFQSEFAGKRVGLFLVASPSMGSGLASTLSTFSGAYGRKLANQLRRNSDALSELDRRFRTMREKPGFSLCGLELVEQKPWKIWRWFLGFIPLRPRLVTPDSASRYFGNPCIVPGSDHSSICKPSGVEHMSHVQLRLFFSNVFEAE